MVPCRHGTEVDSEFSFAFGRHIIVFIGFDPCHFSTKSKKRLADSKLADHIIFVIEVWGQIYVPNISF